MTILLLTDDSIEIPDWIRDLAAFREWFHSDTFPEEGRICFLDGTVWVDTGMEQLFTHNQVKFEFNLVLGGLIKKHRLGRYFPDGVQISNLDAQISVQPDGSFISHASLQAERVSLVPSKTGGFTELLGVPDMVLEVVRRSSVHKDTDRLIELYWRAGVPEYWLVDARKEHIQFDIFRHGRTEYTAVRKVAGYAKSQIFGKSFRLTRKLDESANPEFTLSVR
jgi:Uma2 family endonuclease